MRRTKGLLCAGDCDVGKEPVRVLIAVLRLNSLDYVETSPTARVIDTMRERLTIDITTFDLPSLLGPFLAVIRSSSTSGQITSLALTAIMKFFSYRLITETSPRLALAMQMLSSAVTHCRFEATDPAQD